MQRAVLIAALLVGGGGGVLGAQASARPNTRQGFWIGFGLGDGLAGLNCDACGKDRFGGFSGYLRLGDTWSRSVLVGIEANAWLRSEQGSVSGTTSLPGQTTDESIGYGSLIAMWYPSRTGPLYLKFGLGGMTYHADDGTHTLTATAPSASLGAGCEIRVGRAFSIVPYVNNFVSSKVLMRVDGVADTAKKNIRITLLQFGLGATWH